MKIQQTIEQIHQLKTQGVKMEDILINDDNDVWGASGAFSRQQVEAMIATWDREEQEIADISDLVLADTWLSDNRPADLDLLAMEAQGLHYLSEEAKIILNCGDWSDYWPVVDGDGTLTGAVVDSDTPGRWVNVEDEAMVDYDDLDDDFARKLGGWKCLRENSICNLGVSEDLDHG